MVSNDNNVNPMGILYDEFKEICDNIVIKYSTKAEELETLETQQASDGYLDAYLKRDNFFTYVDYLEYEYIEAGWTDYDTIKEVMRTYNTDLVPKAYRDSLLEMRRAREIDEFEEKNDYYRMLNGYPPLDQDPNKYFYPTEEQHIKYGIPTEIPIHKLQDECNKQSESLGDYYISVIESTGYIDKLVEAHPEEEYKYLGFLGSNRIPLERSRRAHNFQILRLKRGTIRMAVYEEFIEKYDQCREYFMKTLYMSDYKNFLEYYDNFVAMCIMLMATQQMNVGQLLSGVKRQFFSVYGLRELYRAYNVPYDLNIDEDTQEQLVQNLNLLIQNKATNKVLYNIAHLLGFTNIKIYKYLLCKVRNFDIYGVPIVAWTEKFNSDTGEIETLPDYETMYRLYFHKMELKEDNMINTFNDSSLDEDYKEVTSNDPFWFEDEKLYKKIWEAEYNIVESKYLGIGVAYSMTEVMFECILLLKILMTKDDLTRTLMIQIPKIMEAEIPLFDMIIYLCCLTSAKHNLTGEIITIPTQVTSIVDYMRNVDRTDRLVDTLGFNFDFFDYSKPSAKKAMDDIKKMLGEDAYKKFSDSFKKIATTIYNDRTSKVSYINTLFANAKDLYRFITYYMTYTHDRKTYTMLKQLQKAIFYEGELRSVFTITGERTGQKRTAWTYYEYLHWLNPALYETFFQVSENDEWVNYCTEHGLDPDIFTFDKFMEEVEKGNIIINYGRIRDDFIGVKDDKIYSYINHIIDRLAKIVNRIDLIYLINSSSTPLQELLIKLIKFFKSYTVDLISFDTLYVMDLKPGNTIKLFDEMKKIMKTIEYHDTDAIRISHSDLIHLIQETVGIDDHEAIRLYDKFFLSVIFHLDEKSLVKLRDDIDEETKLVLYKEDDGLNKLDDVIHNIRSSRYLLDKTETAIHFSDALFIKKEDGSVIKLN